MKNRTLKSEAFLVCMLFFVFLLIAGSHRLIGGSSESENPVPFTSVAAVSSAFTAIPAVRAESSSPVSRTSSLSKQCICVATVRPPIQLSVLSDANGNVLGHRSYIHEVYQAFVLNDGFV